MATAPKHAVMKRIATITSVDPPTRRTVVHFDDNDGEVRGDNAAAHGGSGTGPDGFDLLAAAFGQCMLNTLLAILGRESVAVRAARAEVRVKVRLQSRSAPRISDLHVDLRLDADVDDAVLPTLFGRAADECGVHATLTPAVRLTGTLSAP